MEASEHFTIHLQLGPRRRTFPITVKREEEELYRAAEKLINERFNHYASRYSNQENDVYLCMAALDIALALKKQEARNDTQPLAEGMERMLRTIEEALAEDAR